MYNTVLFTIGTTLSSSSLEFNHLAQSKLCACLIAIPYFPSPQSLATPILLSALMYVTILDASYMWDHALYVLL